MPSSRQRAASAASDSTATPTAANDTPANALAEVERRLVALSPDFLSVISITGELCWVNPAWEALVGVPVATLIGRSCFDFVHPDDHEATYAEAGRLADGGPTTPFTNRVRRADGSYRWLAWHAAPPIDNLIYAVARDITDQRQVEAALQESERRYRAVIAALEEGVIVQDTEGRIVTVNPGVARILGLPASNLQDRRSTDFAWTAIREDGSPFSLHQTPARTALRTGQAQTNVVMGVQRPDRPLVWLTVSAQPLIREGESIPYGVVSSMFDITARKQAEDELRRSEELARTLWAEADRQARELALLDQVRTALAHELDPAMAYRTVVEATAATFGYGHVGLYLRDGDELILQHQLGYDDAIARIPVIRGVCGRVARTGEAVLLEDVWADPEFFGTPGETFSEVCVPLVVEGTVIGVLNVESTNGARLGPADLRLMAALATQVGLIVARARLYQALGESERDYRLLLDQAADGIFISDAAGNFLTVNARACALTGYSREELLQRGVADLIGIDELPATVRHWGDLQADPTKVLVTERRLLGNGGTTIPVEVSTRLLPDGRLQEIVRDITERKRTEEELRHRAFHDPLTGLPNRDLFTDRLRQALARARRHPTHTFAALCLDLDRFKQINDSLGHPAGDALLVETARRLEGCVREGDTVARLGGDEFAILLEDLAPEFAFDIAGRIQQAITRPFLLGEHEVAVSTSIGIAPGSPRYTEPAELLRDADIALYRSKERGRARHVVFDEAMHTQAVALLQLENDLRRAIERQQFVLHYQPVVALATGIPIGFEALLRWEHPRRGLVAPAEFIALAEETGLIVPLGRWVLAEACHQLAAWRPHLPPDLDLTVGVNLSSRQFALPDLADQVAAALAESGLPARCLRLELTESTLMEQPSAASATLTHLRALGVQVQVDDFGTGYSSLSYLQRFPLDALKIDRSFVGGLGAASEATAIVRAVVSLAHALGLQVVAEGVETAAQRADLRTLNCPYGQGYHFAPALPPDQALTFVTAALAATLAAAD
jgi:diguanylate cyclase (GGDEF)-like protein/PAS domain S-box-containing protein